MSTFINYLIEANMGLIFFLIIYWLWLRNENQFAFKRGYLVLSMVFSSVFPLIDFNYPASNKIIPSLQNSIASHWLPEFVVSGDARASVQSIDGTSFSWSIVFWCYIIIVSLLAFNFAFQLTSLIRLYAASEKRSWNNHLICESDDNQATFSFFNFIFLGQANKLSEREKNEIIKHESVHGTKFHSLDIMIVSVLRLLFWFNPAIYIYRSLLSQVHEFEADAISVQNKDVDEYSMLLSKVALQSAGYPLANHFSYPLTSKRIKMLKTMKHKIQNWKVISIGIAVPLFLFVVACQDQVAKETESKEKGEVYMVVEETATPVGGFTAFIDHLEKNMKYPESARKDKIEGTVYVAFVINKDGTLSDFKVIKSLNAVCDNEAIRVIKGSPLWNPGKQRGMAVRQMFTLPIRFELDQPFVGPRADELKGVVEKMQVSVACQTKGDKVEWGGLVSDNHGLGIPGVNILLKGTSHGTVTDVNGHFDIITGKNGTLVASFVGFETVQVPFAK